MVKAMKTLLVLIFFGPICCLTERTTEAQERPSLTELAGRTKEQKARNKRFVRLITNADLERFQNAPVSLSRPPRAHRSAPSRAQSKARKPVSENKPCQTAPDGPTTREPDLGFWKQTFAEARLNYKTAVHRVLVLQLKMNNLRNAFFREDDGSTQALIQSQMQETLERIEQSKLEIEETKKAIERLQKEARKAGISPQLLRELAGRMSTAESIVVPTTPTP